jgi:DNA-binding NarL/FixJ family response regulator
MRIAFADDSLLVREGLLRLLEHRGHEVVAQVSGAEVLLAQVAHHLPDVVLVDIKMPPTFTDEGLRAATSIHRHHPGIGVLVLSQYVVVEYATALLANAPTHSGYLLKDRLLDGDALEDAMCRVASGETVIAPELVHALLPSPRRTGPVAVLSGREREILSLLAEGLSDRGIAARLFISPNTVGTHIQRIFTKLGLPDSSDVNRRVHAVLTWLQDHRREL